MPPNLASQTCANHPERPGRALCMNCKKVVCQECATQWEGINYCVACLKSRRSESKEQTAIIGWVATIAATVLLFFAASTVLVWAATLMAGLF